MANRLTSNPIYFDQFDTDATLAEANTPLIIRKIVGLSAADGDTFQLEDGYGNVLLSITNSNGAGDSFEVDFGEEGFDFGAQGNGVYIDVSDCTGMAATDGTDAVWIYLV